jgi:hypothetical protein
MRIKELEADFEESQAKCSEQASSLLEAQNNMANFQKLNAELTSQLETASQHT